VTQSRVFLVGATRAITCIGATDFLCLAKEHCFLALALFLLVEIFCGYS